MSRESSKAIFADMIGKAVEDGASDIHFQTNAPAYFRIHGQEIPCGNIEIFRGEIMKDILSEALSQRKKNDIITALPELDEVFESLRQTGGYDFTFGRQVHKNPDGEEQNFRVNVGIDRNGLTLCIRILPKKIPDIQDLGFSSQAYNLIWDKINAPTGIFFVTGPTGSGKSTTLASIIQCINTSVQKHIVTIESPIEFVYPQYNPKNPENKSRCLIKQREVGVSTPSFRKAVKDALRQAPDIILIGEIRDRKTLKAALFASETGHLVFASLHTNGGYQTVSRVVSEFPSDTQEKVKKQLAGSLRGIISQKLLPKADKRGRVLCYEILVNDATIAANLMSGKIEMLNQSMNRENSIRWDECLKDLRDQNAITADTYDNYKEEKNEYDLESN